MPAHRLNPDTKALADRVEELISGKADTSPVPADLAEAVDIYREAGRVALHRRQEHAWFQAHVTPLDWTTAERVFATHITPRLDELVQGQMTWWFLRKHPCWRIRVHTSNHTAATSLFDELATSGAIAEWRPGIYEPEAAAFGGPTGMDIVHDLFCADSHCALAMFLRDSPDLGRRELSLLLVRALQQHAGLDWFEAADVFARVAQMRPIPADADRIDALAMTMKPLLTVSVTNGAPFTDAATAAYAEPWIAAFAQAGQKLYDAAATNRLDRGLRAVLAQIVIFHWNRLGLSAAAQSILAQAAKAAILPRS
ncbi:thiopeptide-type bacteriocin biosynthesis protein [Actinoplanes regularis]|uniref:Thiopeptide-type bacteriocin biosynthesis domain-containing protein n=1 Tax=Actinoplanes regularis TaxID=52697 RepID=A0A239IV87_9ACTN|nr:thiopeptide-type bacteriocin biosynthesis protein [Actinoplanes regularis]GIE91590.1 hypothetical protein Are01nite_80700 [Actinoplanes regularis]SNS97560.1 thiopeptide-type bacteriocin biosynthesis domain-containing protein [Actinoplanes regularis]